MLILYQTSYGDKFVKNWISTLLICAFIAFPSAAKADIAGLTPCAESKAFESKA